MNIYLYGSCECTPKVTFFGALDIKNMTMEDYIALNIKNDVIMANCPFCKKEFELKVKESVKENV